MGFYALVCFTCAFLLRTIVLKRLHCFGFPKSLNSIKGKKKGKNPHIFDFFPSTIQHDIAL